MPKLETNRRRHMSQYAIWIGLFTAGIMSWVGVDRYRLSWQYRSKGETERTIFMRRLWKVAVLLLLMLVIAVVGSTAIPVHICDGLESPRLSWLRTSGTDGSMVALFAHR